MKSRPLSNAFLALLSLPATAMGFALCIQIAALSWLLNTQFGLNIEEVGYVWMAGPLAGIFGQVVVGVISDNVWFFGGRRRPFILVGGTMAALMLLALPNIGLLSSTTGWDLMVVAIAVALTLDLAINISFNPTRSLIADVTPAGDERTRGFTWMQTVSGCFGVMAYAIAAWWGNISLIYLGVALVLLFSVVPTLLIEEPRRLVEEQPEETDQGEARGTALELTQISFAHGFAWLGIQTMFVFLFAFIQQKLSVESDQAIGQVIAVAFAVLNIVGFLLPALVLEPIARRLGKVKTHAVCMGVMAVGYFAMASLATTPAVLYCLMAVVGVGWAATVSLPFAILSEKVSAHRMGMFMGIFNLSVVIPQLIVSWKFGRLIEHAVDKSIVFYISAIALAASALLWSTVADKQVASESVETLPEATPELVAV